MRHYANLNLLLGAALTLVGCAAEDVTSTDHRVRRLVDENGNGLFVEQDANAEEGCVVMPGEDECAYYEWTETHTVITDADGNIISETYSVCTQCYDADGNPVGEAECYEEPPIPPDVFCEEYDSGDPTLACYRCITPDGEIVTDECWPLPVECTSDADCPEGQICYFYETMGEDSNGDGMIDPASPVPGGSGGFCGFPDPCVYVDTIPEDPTGESCWVCTDPSTGEDWGRWCDFHRCGDDGSCVNPWEVCNPDTGYCEYDDPCDPVESLPDDPTGTDCYLCVDPMGGGEWGWCNFHTCTTDEECAVRGEICNEDTGLCEYDDPCDAVESLPGDPTGYDCYQCIDPMTGEDWGGWCNGHTCETSDDCLAGGFGDTCDEGICFWTGCGDGTVPPDGGGSDPGMP